MNHAIVFGCVADDFTGASDAASFLVAGGLNTLLFSGIPADDAAVPARTDAIVIALKTRTAETAAAVGESLRAVRWLKQQGAEQLFIKYCSTFDSTPEGNIGPICDAAIAATGSVYSLVCPSLPINKRTVRDGILYVDDVPLAETHMRSHPLTPMWASSLPELLKDQSRFPAIVLSRRDLYREADRLAELIRGYQAKHEHFYLVPDFETEDDAEQIVAQFGSLPLLTGGSGLMRAIGHRIRQSRGSSSASPGIAADTEAAAPAAGRAIIFAGSCSVATQAQVQHFLAGGGYGIRLDPEKLLSGEQTIGQINAQIANAAYPDLLIYSAGSGGIVRESDDHHAEAAVLEQTVAALAVQAVRRDYSRIVVAGGETSGAVTQALDFHAYRIGPSVAPGVPVMTPLSAPGIRLILKSGNFGQVDFFDRALAITRSEQS